MKRLAIALLLLGCSGPAFESGNLAPGDTSTTAHTGTDEVSTSTTGDMRAADSAVDSGGTGGTDGSADTSGAGGVDTTGSTDSTDESSVTTGSGSTTGDETTTGAGTTGSVDPQPCPEIESCTDEPECSAAITSEYHGCTFGSYKCGNRLGYFSGEGHDFPCAALGDCTEGSAAMQAYAAECDGSATGDTTDSSGSGGSTSTDTNSGGSTETTGVNCVCSEGECCDGCHFLGVDTVCATDVPYTSSCNNDWTVRVFYGDVLCSGHSPHCDGIVLHKRQANEVCPEGSACRSTPPGTCEPME